MSILEFQHLFLKKITFFEYKFLLNLEFLASNQNPTHRIVIQNEHTVFSFIFDW